MTHLNVHVHAENEDVDNDWDESTHADPVGQAAHVGNGELAHVGTDEIRTYSLYLGLLKTSIKICEPCTKVKKQVAVKLQKKYEYVLYLRTRSTCLWPYRVP